MPLRVQFIIRDEATVSWPSAIATPVRKNTSLSFTSKQLSKGSAIRYADDGVSLIRSREKEQERNKMIGEDKIATSVCDVILYSVILHGTIVVKVFFIKLLRIVCRNNF